MENMTLENNNSSPVSTDRLLGGSQILGTPGMCGDFFKTFFMLTRNVLDVCILCS